MIKFWSKVSQADFLKIKDKLYMTDGDYKLSSGYTEDTIDWSSKISIRDVGKLWDLKVIPIHKPLVEYITGYFVKIKHRWIFKTLL